MTIPNPHQQLHLSYQLDEPLPPAIQTRIELIADLGRRRNAILQSETFDLAAARELVMDYEVAGFMSCAADLRRRVEWYEAK